MRSRSPFSLPSRPRALVVLGLSTLVGLASSAAYADATLDKIRQQRKVVIGVLASGGPFGAIDPATQQLVGWNPELARDLAKRLGAEPELVQVQPSNRVQFLQSGKVDLLIASMEYNPDRGEILGYAPTPFYRVGGTAAALKTSGITNWEDLRGKTVCASQGSSFVKPLQEQYGAQVRGFKSAAESLLALRGGACVAAVHDATLIHPLLRQQSEWASHHAPIATEILPAVSVVWTRKGEDDTIAAVDRVVQEWHRSGWLLATEKRLGISPAQPLLAELHARYKSAP
ncbi:transporter substrate-binding domain-containing protein [Azohydromonas lata]|uniref:Transporter substrate-binding domain-containing protein n=1 Tax=Azohydromonas lata TaxID=45677 RepID=A0ABU5IFV1_9BURK|nr:transporter substrate-binding domain-containing protein [Azohydromonas lata]MDZ5457991.1 transporter substrate-binding domain-containing protein [Azohydromonas lata]